MAQTTYGQCSILLDKDTSVFTTFGDKPDSFNRKCKIICTMGPSCWDQPILEQMIESGMNIARLNFSHGDHETHARTVESIRNAAAKFPDKAVGILLDTKGPEIRTGFFREGVGDKIELVQGQTLKLVTDYDFKGDNTCIAVSYQSLPTSVKPGNTILMADGSLSLIVRECGEDYVITTVGNSIKLGERKNCNLPGVKVNLPVLQQKDREDIVKFAIPQSVDFIAASFVQCGEDVDLIKKQLGVKGQRIKIISKIENEEGINNIDEIIEKSDGIMVARGDMGMEIPPEDVFVAQKMIIAKCNLVGRPVVTATQMLESMTAAPRPTRAEAGDVANAVLDGTDCVMLSGETAGGKFPLNAVSIMRHICEEAEAVIDYDSLYLGLRQGTLSHQSMDAVESTCSSAVKATIDSNCPLIVVLTETGHTARAIAKYRPKAPILAICTSENSIRHLACVRGVVTLLAASFQGTDSVIAKALTKAKELGMVKAGDIVVAVHGLREEVRGHSNLMKMVTVPESP